MTKYVALLRGISPLNPNMRNDKLRAVFEHLGFSNVRTVIASGNVLFETAATDTAILEAKIEAALPDQLDFKSTTIVRSQRQLQDLANKNPFAGYRHEPKTSLNVTFLKQPPAADQNKLPAGAGYQVLISYSREICSVVDTTAAKTPDLMRRLEKQFGQEITTRSWQTVIKILKKFD